MKNKSFKIHNEEPDRCFFLHEQLLNALLIPIIVTDRKDKLIYQNKEFTDIVGYNFASANKSMKEIVEREDWNNWNENLFKLSSFRDDNSSVFNIRFKTKSAGIKFLKLEGKVFQRSEDDRPLLYLFTIEDLTIQVKDVIAASTNGDLTIAWKNFTDKTSTEKKLELAIKDLDRSNKDLEEFAYVTSHDLQEPLRKITSFSTMLAARFSEQLNDEGKLYIEKINTAAGNMRELIENLLQISRTVQHPRPFAPTDLNKILNEVKQNLDLKIEEGSVQIIQEQLPVVDALPPLMMQLFNNLLSNAIKFSSKNQTAIIHITSSEVSSAEKDVLLLPNDKTYYKIIIKDNGIGFGQESAKDIFKIFFRLNDKTNYPGTGIGLSICSKIVEKHKGLLWAESEAEKGASFFIILPKTQAINDH